jgi:hypothetical protein
MRLSSQLYLLMILIHTILDIQGFHLSPSTLSSITCAIALQIFAYALSGRRGSSLIFSIQSTGEAFVLSRFKDSSAFPACSITYLRTLIIIVVGNHIMTLSPFRLLPTSKSMRQISSLLQPSFRYLAIGTTSIAHLNQTVTRSHYWNGSCHLGFERPVR